MANNFDTLISDGWQNHDRDSESVAQSLETVNLATLTATQAGQLLRLSNHTIGEHLGYWQRAKKLADVVSQRPDLRCSAVYSQLAVACFLGNDPAAAQQAEIECVRSSFDEVMATYLTMKAQLAAALVGSDRLSEGVLVYDAAITLADGVEEQLSSDRAIAITSNNLANDLLELTQRTGEQDELMQNSAGAALKYWSKCGTWENEERAYYLLALVANVLANHQGAIDHATRALQIIAANGDEPIDEVFIRLSAASAYKRLQQMTLYQAELDRADLVAAAWDDPSLLEQYREERARIERAA